MPCGAGLRDGCRCIGVSAAAVHQQSPIICYWRFRNLAAMKLHEAVVTNRRASSKVLLWQNSVLSSDAMWRQRSWLTMAQIMACCWQHWAITWINVDSRLSIGIHPSAISTKTCKICWEIDHSDTDTMLYWSWANVCWWYGAILCPGTRNHLSNLKQSEAYRYPSVMW